MELFRILVMSVVFVESSSTLTTSTRGGVQAQQQRPLSLGDDGNETPGLFMVGGHQRHRKQQQGPLHGPQVPLQGPPQRPQRTAIGFEQQRNLTKQRYTDNIKTYVINLLNITDSQASSSPSSLSEGGRPEVRPEVGRKKGNTRKTMLRRENKHKIISYGEKVSNVSDNRVVQFSLSEAASKRGSDGSSLSVTEATVSVLFRRNRTTANQQRPGAPPAEGDPEAPSPAVKGHQRRHTISVYVLNTPKASDDDDGVTTSSDPIVGALAKPVALLTVAPQKTRWLKVLLPTSVAQAAIDSEDQVLRLLITCDTCRDGDDVMTVDEPASMLPLPLLRRPNTRNLVRSKKGQGDDDLSQQRRRPPAAEAEERYLPFLVVHTKAKPRPVTMATTVTKTTRRSSCKQTPGC